MDEDDIPSLQGPVEKIDGTLVLRIPLKAGGAPNSSIVLAASLRLKETF
jgi:hypothetical protein